MFGSKPKDSTGIRLLQQGKWDEALQHYTRAHHARPNDVDTRLEIAKIYFKKAQFHEAKKSLESALNSPLSPKQVQTVLELTNHRKISSDRFFNFDPAFSPDGKWLAFGSARADSNGDGKIDAQDNAGLYAVNLQNGSEIAISTDEFHNGHPAFSPDSKKALFLSVRKDSNGDGRIDARDVPGLYLKDLHSGQEECLIESSHHPKFPSFSPDGNSVLFCAWYGGASRCGVYILNLKTHHIRILHDAFESSFPVFSPSGAEVAFTGWPRDANGDGRINLSDRSGLFSVNLATSRVRPIAPEAFSHSFPAYSFDGTKLVYLSRRRDTNGDGRIDSLDNAGLYVRSASGAEALVSRDDHYNKFPCFSPDGDRVMAISSWRKPHADPDRPEDYFEPKGIHCFHLKDGISHEVVSSKNFGCRYLVSSPKEDLIAYTSWRKDSNRGLYLARPHWKPTRIELLDLVKANL